MRLRLSGLGPIGRPGIGFLCVYSYCTANFLLAGKAAGAQSLRVLLAVRLCHRKRYPLVPSRDFPERNLRSAPAGPTQLIPRRGGGAHGHLDFARQAVITTIAPQGPRLAEGFDFAPATRGSVVVQLPRSLGVDVTHLTRSKPSRRRRKP